MCNNERKAITQIIGVFELIQEFVEGMSEQKFMFDEKTRRSVLMTLINVAEKSKAFSDDFRKRNPDFPVHKIIALRNVAAHTYDGVRYEMVWHAVLAIPELKQKLIDML